jgi:hypothetical protein
MAAFVRAGAGFLLAVLWFDLMFDVQVLRPRRGDLPEPVLASIADYYRRVTTEARPMNRLVAATMLATLVALVLGIARGPEPRWLGPLRGSSPAPRSCSRRCATWRTRFASPRAATTQRSRAPPRALWR